MNNFNLSLKDAIAIQLFVKWVKCEDSDPDTIYMAVRSTIAADTLTRQLRSRSVVFSPFPPVEETAIDPLWCHVVNPHSTL